MCENIDFGRNFRKILILVEIFENLDWGSKFAKILDFGQNLRKISVLVEIFQNLSFGRNLQ